MKDVEAAAVEVAVDAETIAEASVEADVVVAFG